MIRLRPTPRSTRDRRRAARPAIRRRASASPRPRPARPSSAGSTRPRSPRAAVPAPLTLPPPSGTARIRSRCAVRMRSATSTPRPPAARSPSTPDPPQTTIASGPAAGARHARPDADLRLLRDRGRLDVPVPDRRGRVRRVQRSRCPSHSRRARERPAQVRGPRDRCGRQRRRDARQPRVHGRRRPAGDDDHEAAEEDDHAPGCEVQVPLGRGAGRPSGASWTRVASSAAPARSGSGSSPAGTSSEFARSTGPATPIPRPPRPGGRSAGNYVERGVLHRARGRVRAIGVDARAVGPGLPARRAAGGARGARAREGGGAGREADRTRHVRDPAPGADRRAARGGAGRASRPERRVPRGLALRPGGRADPRLGVAPAHGAGRARSGARRGAARARPRGRRPARLLPDRRGRRLPHGDGVPLRVRLVPGAGPGRRLDAHAPSARGGGGAVAAPARRRRGRLRQRRERRARLPALPLHQHGPDAPPAPAAGNRVGVPGRRYPP